MKKYILFCVTIFLLSIGAFAQSPGYIERAKKYIDQYATLAILEQRKSGIPASITLGQGILETEAGASELMTEANNHFGIKCKTGWQGPYYTHDDDAPNEHFKKYSCAAESYSDHSALLLNNPRYAPLLTIPQTDYGGWAKCLRKCGYATSPTYAQQLIKIIEDFKLQDYTYTALDSSLKNSQLVVPSRELTLASATGSSEKSGIAANAVENQTRAKTMAMAQPDSSRIKVTAANKANPQLASRSIKTDTVVKATATLVGTPIAKVTVHHDTVKPQPAKPVAAVVPPASKPVAALPAPKPASKPVAPVSPVISKPVDESHIVMINGLQAFYAYKDEMILQYAMKYHKTYQQLLSMNDLPDGPLPFNMYVYLDRKLTRGANAQHEVKEGESLLMVAQEEGMQLKSIMDLNLLNPNEEPTPGTILELQNPAHLKPAVNQGELTAHARNSIVLDEELTPVASTDFIELPKSKPVARAGNGKPDAATANHMKTGPSDLNTSSANVAPDPQFEAFLDSVAKAYDNATASASRPHRTVPDVNQLAGNTTGNGNKFYTVKRGDTAFSIAKNNNITLEQLMKWNNMDGHITIGQNLQVKE